MIRYWLADYRWSYAVHRHVKHGRLVSFCEAVGYAERMRVAA